MYPRYTEIDDSDCNRMHNSRYLHDVVSAAYTRNHTGQTASVYYERNELEHQSLLISRIYK